MALRFDPLVYHSSVWLLTSVAAVVLGMSTADCLVAGFVHLVSAAASIFSAAHLEHA